MLTINALDLYLYKITIGKILFLQLHSYATIMK